MTQVEFTSACEGYLQKHARGGKLQPVTSQEMRELMEQFPD